MTREQMISRWEKIIPTVFRAEDTIRPRLQEIRNNEPDKEKAAQQYFRAIAEEIVSRTSDEQLSAINEEEY